VLWLAVCLTGLALTLAYPENSDQDGFGSFLMVITWIAGCGQAFALRGQYVRRVRARDASPIVLARERLHERDEARKIAARDPRLALEMGIGRPDRARADDGGLIDVNHVPESILTRLPGVDRALARRIAQTRRDVRGFSSLEDMGTVMDLPPDAVEEMRERAIFLPRH
jgi:Helix-hairpin-helix motif